MSDDSQQYTIQSQPKRSYKKLTEKTKHRLKQKVLIENMSVARAARNLKVKSSASKVYMRKVKEELVKEMQKQEEKSQKQSKNQEIQKKEEQNNQIQYQNKPQILFFWPNTFPFSWINQ